VGRARFLCAAVALAGSLGTASGVSALPSRWVQNYGVDVPGCGTQAFPCRSITHAIAAASPGATIWVGPGRYGDLNRNGQFDAGDEGPPRHAEFGFVSAWVAIDKSVSVLSTHGAEVTQIDIGAGLPSPDGNAVPQQSVGLFSNDLVFGDVGHGFRVKGGTGTAIGGIGTDAEIELSNVRISGNIVEGGGIGISLSQFVEISDNQVLDAETGIYVSLETRVLSLGTGPVTIVRNTLRGNRFGAFLYGKGITFSGNIVDGNSEYGISASDFDPTFTDEAQADMPRSSIDDNYIVGNGTTGLSVRALGAVVHNAVIGNVRGGLLQIAYGTLSRLELNDFYGNGSLPAEPARPRIPSPFPANCGIVFDDSAGPIFGDDPVVQLVARNNYWGAATGPGPDPADDSGSAGLPCQVRPPPVLDTPFATLPFDVPIPVKRAAPRG
jgi:hypothetical protein